MGGRSVAAKGATLEPPGRPPQPSSADPAEPLEPGSEPGSQSEPGLRNLVPTEPQPANHSALQPGANPPQRFSGQVHKAAARPGTHPAAELLLLLLGASAAAWEHLGAGAEEKAAERRARPKPGTAPPASRRTRPHHVLIGHCRHRLPQGHASSHSQGDPGRAGPRSNQTGVLRLSLLGTELRAARCSPLPSVCEGEAGKPQTLLQRGFSASPRTSAVAKKSSCVHCF